MCINCSKKSQKLEKEPEMRFLAIFKFDWSDKFDIAYIHVAQSVAYDLVNFADHL